MITALRRSGPRAASSALGAAFVLGACGGAPDPAAVESCLREEGLSAARQPGTSPPVEAKINFATAGTPDPETSGKVIFYTSEEEAARNLQASERGDHPLRQKGKVLYSPFHARGTPEESEALVEGCVVNGEAGAAAEDDDSDKKKKKKKRR